MKCSKCGQQTVNINDKHICTACGVVVSDTVSPKDQIVSRAKEKTGSNNEVPEKYVSPSDLALNKDTATPDFPGEFKSKKSEDEETLSAIASSLDDKAVLSEEMQIKKEPKDTGSEKDGLVPSRNRLSSEPPVQSHPASTKSDKRVPTFQSLLHDTPQEENIYDEPEANQEIIGTKSFSTNVVPRSKGALKEENESLPLETEMPEVYQNNPSSSSEASIYPSHQVNPLFVRILIYSFAILSLFLLSFFLYPKISGSGNIVEKIGTFLGNNFLK